MPRITQSLAAQAAAASVPAAQEPQPATVQLPACLQNTAITTPPKSASGPYIQIVAAKADNFAKALQLGFQEHDAVLIDGDHMRRVEAFHLIAADTLYTSRASDGSIVECWETDPGKSVPGASEDIQAVLLVYTPDGVFAATGGFRATRAPAMKTMGAAVNALNNENAWAQVVGRFVKQVKTAKSGPRAGQNYTLIDAQTFELAATFAQRLQQYFKDEEAKPEEAQQLVNAYKAHESRKEFMLRHVKRS